jgi:nucleoside-diphosphate-sugar epimerase
LREADDVFTNHIHADDLARACVLALWRGLPQRVINVSDDTQLRMGEYMRLAARLYALPEPQQVSRAEAAKSLTPMALSFMGESRRLLNQRMKAELRLRLSHPTVATGLLSSSPAAR